EDLSYLARVNTVFKNICYDPQLWNSVLNKHTNFQTKERVLIDKIGCGLCTMQKLIGHTSGSDALCMDENFLYSGSQDNTIRIWDLKTNQCVGILQGHSLAVMCLCIDKNFLYSGSKDQTIKVWNRNTGNYIATLKGHEGFVNCLWIDGNFLYSGSGDATIRIWDIRTNECVEIFQGHDDSVLCIWIEEDILYSGSWDGTIKIWGLSIGGMCTNTLFDSGGRVICLYKDKDFLYSGLGNGTIGIWDARTWTCRTIQAHKFNFGVNCFYKEGNCLYSGGLDDTIKGWNATTWQCEAVFRCLQDGGNDAILSIQKKGNIFYTTSWARTIKMWDFNVSYFTLLEAAQAIGEQMQFDLFFSFSKACKNEIYKELYTITGIPRNPFERDIENEKLELAIYRFVLKHISHLFETGSKRKALDLFHKLPSKIKDPIYEELLKLDINTAHHKETTGSSILDFLPAELLYQMSLEVFPEDLLALARVNKAFKELTSDTQIWQTVLSKHTDLKTKEEYLSRIQEKIQIDKMKNGIYTEQEFAVHQNSVTCFCKEKTILYVASSDRTINIWDLVTKQCIVVLQCEEIVCSLYIDETTLYVGTTDAIEIWDTLTKERVGTLRGVQGYVYCIRKNKNILYSGSSNGMIKMWDLTKKHCIGFFAHQHGVSRLLNEGHILYAAAGNNVKIWNASTGKAVATLGCNSRIYCLFREGDLLYVGTWDEILIWDLAKQECIEVLHGHGSLVYSLCKEGNILYSGTFDGTIRAWDLTTNQCVATIRDNSNEQCVFFLCKEKDALYSGSLDKKVRMWDFSVSYSTLLEAAQAILHEGDFDLYISFSEVCLNAANEEVQALQTIEPNIPTNKAIGLAIYRVVAKQIDSLMKTGSRRQALDLLKKLPVVIQDVIYDENLGIIDWKKIYPSCIEHAFLSSNGLNTTNDKRKEAIQSFLETRDVPK
ncbi:MAG TPA: hypothetical protein VLG49_08130, partial [Rhabdochlamydiaceae bacterium]|nr:hypothetical protein [Rhabdochlamydiaceae bacterium]